MFTPSTPSTPKLPRGVQAVLVIICLGLGAVYVFDPVHRQTPGTVSQWVQHLAQAMGLRSNREEMLLAPDERVRAGAQPLIDFGAVQFLGCDRAMQSNQLSLVTYWRIAAASELKEVQLRFVLPDRSTHEVTQLLDRATLLTPVPDKFGASGQRGELWLNLPSAGDKWVRICK
jgi:hypothetical protein